MPGGFVGSYPLNGSRYSEVKQVDNRQDHFSLLQKIYYKLTRPMLTDRAFSQMSMNRWLGGGHLEDPRTFNEKIQWLKVFHRDPLFPKLADKYSVRETVEERVGSWILNELYQVCDDPRDIDWHGLPNSFVLKATHGSGMNVLVRDKSTIDISAVTEQLRNWLKTDYSRFGREWVYRDTSRRIIAEAYLVDANGAVPKDYKVFCFKGLPRYIQVDVDRFTNHTRAFYDLEWNQQPFTTLYPIASGSVSPPEHLRAMLAAAEKLAKGIPFVRIDFYALPRLVFGEMTFFPGNGTEPFDPPVWDATLGQMITLPLSRHDS